MNIFRFNRQGIFASKKGKYYPEKPVLNGKQVSETAFNTFTAHPPTFPPESTRLSKKIFSIQKSCGLVQQTG